MDDDPLDSGIDFTELDKFCWKCKRIGLVIILLLIIILLIIGVHGIQ